MKTTKQFKHIGVFGKYGASYFSETIARVFKIITAHAVEVSLDQDTMPEELRHHYNSKPVSEWSTEVDLAVVIGGDGTFLHAGRMLSKRGIPLLGINNGRLGFLADIPLSTIESELSAILNGHYRIEQRQMLTSAIYRNSQLLASFNAINDLVIHKRRMARMIELDVYIREQFLSRYSADGLIISTPTGSTAYALSAGGPVIEPTLAAILIAPICPHTLTQRPLVIGNHSTIEVFVRHDSIKDIQLTIDGQEEHLLLPGDTVVIGSSENLSVIHPANYHFQERLRCKLNWGLSPKQLSIDDA